MLSCNPNITLENIKETPDKPWNYYLLSKNPNITWKIIKENPNEPWDYDYLSENEMTKYRENFIRKKFQEWFKKSALKEELIAKLWHPSNFEKFKYYDPDMFDNDNDNDMFDNDN